MFLDGYDLGAALASGFSTLAQNAYFVSTTLVGMTIGTLRAAWATPAAAASPIRSIF